MQLARSPELIAHALIMEHCPPDKAIYVFRFGVLLNGVLSRDLHRLAEYYMWDELALQLLTLCGVSAAEASLRIDDAPEAWT